MAVRMVDLAEAMMGREVAGAAAAPLEEVALVLTKPLKAAPALAVALVTTMPGLLVMVGPVVVGLAVLERVALDRLAGLASSHMELPQQQVERQVAGLATTGRQLRRGGMAEVAVVNPLFSERPEEMAETEATTAAGAVALVETLRREATEEAAATALAVTAW